MAKKRQPEAVPPGTKHVRLELSEEQQARLRVLAARAGMSMAGYARAVIVRAIDEDARRSAPGGEDPGA